MELFKDSDGAWKWRHRDGRVETQGDRITRLWATRMVCSEELYSRLPPPNGGRFCAICHDPVYSRWDALDDGKVHHACQNCAPKTYARQKNGPAYFHLPNHYR